MTGILMAMMGVKGFRVLSGTVLASSTNTAINPQLRFQTDGTVLYRLSDNSTGTDFWGRPPTPGVGTAYTLTVATPTGTGAGSVTGVFNSPQFLTAELVYTMTAAGVGASRDASATYTIKDGGGTTVGGGTLLFSSDRT